MIDYIILGIICILIILTVRSYIKKKKSGKSFCGCGCDNCKSDLCHIKDIDNNKE